MTDHTPAAEAWQTADPAALFALERLDADLFQNRFSAFTPNNHLFGGQVLGQALAAAVQTVTGRDTHSLHAYFLRAGDPTRKVTFRVETLRDGRSFSVRHVRATQDNAAIFEMMASFHVDEAGGLRHAFPMPADTRLPDGLPTLDEMVENGAPPVARTIRERLAVIRGMEVRPHKAPGDAPHDSGRRFWIRMPTMAAIADMGVHQLFLAYLSDYWLAGGAVAQHHDELGAAYPSMASLDHALWFHRPARVDDWLLYDIDSPHAGNMLGLARGSLYDRAGNLVFSSVQQALMRV